MSTKNTNKFEYCIGLGTGAQNVKNVKQSDIFQLNVEVINAVSQKKAHFVFVHNLVSLNEFW